MGARPRVALVPPLAAVIGASIAVAGLARRIEEGGAGNQSYDPVVVPAVSVALLLLSGAQLFVHRRVGPPLMMMARIGAGVVTLLGLAIVVQYAVDWGTGDPRGTLFGLHSRWAQRPSPATGLGLALLGASFCALTLRGQRARAFSNTTATIAFVLALTAVVGHAYGATLLYGHNPWGGTAIATAFGLVALAQGARFTQPVHGAVAIAVGPGPGGQLMRRLVPVALGAPFLLGWLSVTATQAELIESRFGTALVTVLLSLLLVVLIVRQASLLNRVSAEREQLVARERVSHERVTNILESITEAFFAVDREWRFTYANREAERLLRRPRHELIGSNVWEEFPEAIGAGFEREYERAMAEQRTVHFEEYFAPLGIWFEVH